MESLNQNQDTRIIRGFDDAIGMMELYEKLKRIMEENNTNNSNRDLHIDDVSLKRIKLNNYILDVIKFLEKIELDKVEEEVINEVIKVVFDDTAIYKGKKIKDLTDIEDKKEAIKQFRNCLAHAHYSIIVDNGDNLTIDFKKENEIKYEISEDELKKMVEKLILFLKKNTKLYLSHLSDFSYSGYDLNVLIDTLFNRNSELYGKEDKVFREITPKRYATLLQSYNYYFGYLYEKTKNQRIYAPGQNITNSELLIQHPPKIGKRISEEENANTINVKNFDLKELDENRLNDVLRDFYGFFKSMTEQMKQNCGIDDIDGILTQLDEYFDGRKQDIDLERITEIYLSVVPRLLRIQGNELTPKAKNIFGKFVMANSESNTFIWPKLEDLVIEDNDWKKNNENMINNYLQRVISNEINRLKREKNKNTSNERLIGILSTNDRIEGALLDLVGLQKVPLGDLKKQVEELRSIQLKYADILQIEKGCNELELAIRKLEEKQNEKHFDYSKLFDGIRNSIMHGNVDIDYSDYIIDGVKYKVVNDDGSINFENIRFTFQDFDDKKEKTTFLLMNLRGEDLVKITEYQKEKCKENINETYQYVRNSIRNIILKNIQERNIEGNDKER